MPDNPVKPNGSSKRARTPDPQRNEGESRPSSFTPQTPHKKQSHVPRREEEVEEDIDIDKAIITVLGCLQMGGGVPGSNASVQSWSILVTSVLEAIHSGVKRTKEGSDEEIGGIGIGTVIKEVIEISNTLEIDLAPETYGPSGFASQPFSYPGSDLSNEIKELSKTFNTAFASLSGRMSRIEVQTGSPPNPKTTSTPSNKTPTYASTAAAPATEQPAPQKPKPKPTPPKLLRFVVRFGTDKLDSTKRVHQHLIVKNINEKLRTRPNAEGLSALGAVWTPQGNCIIHFPAGTSAERVSRHADILAEVCSAGKKVEVSRDIPWSKVVIGGVMIKEFFGGATHTDAQLSDALKVNDAIQKLNIVQSVRWVKRESELDGVYSSVSFAFEDPDGTRYSQLSKQKLFMFGSQVSIRLWRDKPRLQQCIRCHGFSHTTRGCQAEKARCGVCSSVKHSEPDHRKSCTDPECSSAPAETACTHFYCYICNKNGGKGHRPGSAECPARLKYCAPVSENTSSNDKMPVDT